jgi:hypothetical protein
MNITIVKSRLNRSLGIESFLKSDLNPSKKKSLQSSSSSSFLFFFFFFFCLWGGGGGWGWLYWPCCLNIA